MNVISLKCKQLCFLIALNMSDFASKKVYLRGILLHYFIQKKSAVDACRVLVETYGDHAPLETTSRDWFRRFKNNDFDVGYKEHSGATKKVWRRRIANITSWRLMSGASSTWRIMRSWSQYSFETFENIRCRTSWTRETWNSVMSRVNSCFNDRKGKGYFDH